MIKWLFIFLSVALFFDGPTAIQHVQWRIHKAQRFSPSPFHSKFRKIINRVSIERKCPVDNASMDMHNLKPPRKIIYLRGHAEAWYNYRRHSSPFRSGAYEFIILHSTQILNNIGAHNYRRSSPVRRECRRPCLQRIVNQILGVHSVNDTLRPIEMRQSMSVYNIILYIVVIEL